jgi:hypothetical protein
VPTRRRKASDAGEQPEGRDVRSGSALIRGNNGHQLVWHAAQVKRLVEKGEDPDRFLRRHGADPQQEPAVVVDEGDEVGRSAPDRSRRGNRTGP